MYVSHTQILGADEEYRVKKIIKEDHISVFGVFRKIYLAIRSSGAGRIRPQSPTALPSQV